MSADGFADLRVLQSWSGRRAFIPADPASFREALLESTVAEVAELAGVSHSVTRRIGRALGVAAFVVAPRGRPRMFQPDPAEFKLRLREGWTRPQLARGYGVTTRTIDREVTRLGLQGVSLRVNQFA